MSRENPSGECCGGCLCVVQDGAILKCRRYPKVLVIAATGQNIIGGTSRVISQWDYPPTKDDEWCGEFRRRGK